MIKPPRRRPRPGWPAALLRTALLELAAQAVVSAAAVLALAAGLGSWGVATVLLAVAAGALPAARWVGRDHAEVGAPRCNEGPPSPDR
ncbi:hypothetical protein AB0M46_42320 [Dactylosporangium sp. NPDC051485]|uniref:hypothetical protein n=1 Tax=Dactylosporangium sp. NPDC051485 TaxID=3154846 RepID=UPI003430E6B9